MNDWQTAMEMLDSACFATFAIPVVYIPSLETRMELGGTPVDLEGIFDEKREVVSLMGTDGMDAVIPRSVLEIRLSDLGFSPMEGDEVTIGGVPYRILDVQSSGTGVAVLIINRMQDPFAF